MRSATWQRSLVRIAAMLAVLAFTHYVLSLDAAAAKRAEAAKKAPVSADTDGLSSVNFPPYPVNMLYPIRIGIGNRIPAARIAVWAPGAVFIDLKPIFVLHPGLVYLISNGRITEYATGRSCALPTDARTRISSNDYRIWCSNRWWRGSLEIIQFPNNTLTVINLLDLENYLMGVVPSEMPSSWHLEALKAQAVAARSYAAAHMGDGSKWKSEGYDLVPDVRDQAYKGTAAEAASTNLAVAQTMGIILKDSGRVKPGFYRAWVGDSEENLNMRHKVVSSSVLEGLTGVKNIVGVTVKQWDGVGNAHSIQVMGAKKSTEVYGVELAKRLGLATAGILDVRDQGASNWLFTYRGPGNGSRGLSQHGADMLASHGWRFEQILQQYYQDPDGRLRLELMDKWKMIAAARARFQAVTPAKKTAATPTSGGTEEND